MARYGFRIDTAGNIMEFGPTVGPGRMTTGPDGNMWFTEPFNNKISRITPAGVMTELSLPIPTYPRDIVAGPDGNLWFTELNAGQLARITPDGVVTKVQKCGVARGALEEVRVAAFGSRRCRGTEWYDLQ